MGAFVELVSPTSNHTRVVGADVVLEPFGLQMDLLPVHSLFQIHAPLLTAYTTNLIKTLFVFHTGSSRRFTVRKPSGIGTLVAFGCRSGLKPNRCSLKPRMDTNGLEQKTVCRSAAPSPSNGCLRQC